MKELNNILIFPVLPNDYSDRLDVLEIVTKCFVCMKNFLTLTHRFALSLFHIQFSCSSIPSKENSAIFNFKSQFLFWKFRGCFGKYSPKYTHCHLSYHLGIMDKNL